MRVDVGRPSLQYIYIGGVGGRGLWGLAPLCVRAPSTMVCVAPFSEAVGERHRYIGKW